MLEFPPEMRIPETTKVDVAIPGWHINAHGESCCENFNLSYMEGAGRTVGEDIETTWAGTNALGPSVRGDGSSGASQYIERSLEWVELQKDCGISCLFLGGLSVYQVLKCLFF